MAAAPVVAPAGSEALERRAARLDSLVREIEAQPGDAERDRALEAVSLILEIHRAGLERVRDGGDAGPHRHGGCTPNIGE